MRFPVAAKMALVIAGISVVAKEAVYQYTNRAAKALDSTLLRANAWHSRTDALSSLIVIAGVLGVMMGVAWADAVGAIGVALIILHAAFQIGREAFDELIDTGLDEDSLVMMRNAILEVPGVVGVHELRTRRMGGKVLADVHIHVAPRISVSEGHRIGDAADQRGSAPAVRPRTDAGLCRRHCAVCGCGGDCSGLRIVEPRPRRHVALQAPFRAQSGRQAQGQRFCTARQAQPAHTGFAQQGER